MKGPDPLAGGQRGGRSALGGSGTADGSDSGPGPLTTGRPTPAEGLALSADPAGSDEGSAGQARPAKGRGGSPHRLSLSNWPVSVRLVAVFVVASLAGLVFGGLRVTEAIGTAQAYGRTAQLATLGEQDMALAQALEDERDLSAGVRAYQALSADAAADKAGPAVTQPLTAALTSAQSSLTAAEEVTDSTAATAKQMSAAIGGGFPAGVQADAGQVTSMIAGIPALRGGLDGRPTSQVVAGYANAIAVIFALNDEIADGSGDFTLAYDVRALGGLSRATDQASQQRAVVFSGLIESSVDDAGTTAPASNIGGQALADAGGSGALTTAQGLQSADMTDFSDSAPPTVSGAYLATVTGRQDNQARLIGNLVSQSGDPRLVFERVGAGSSLGLSQATAAATWYSDQSTVISQMRSVAAQLTAAIAARGQLLQQGAMDSALVTGAVTVAAVLLVLLLTVLIGRSLVNPLRRLQEDALQIATIRLPAQVAAAARGADSPAGQDSVEPVDVRSTDEIGRVARAFDEVHAQAVRLAGTEAQLRGSLSAMFISLSRRSVPLIERLARMIDSMEQTEDDPNQLANLFAMDHLVTRMRRNSENLLVLAGEEPVRKWTESVPLTDVARAAASEIEQYGRVALAVQPGIMVSGQAAADIVHLLAELIENATLFSPQSTQVHVTVTELSSGGALVDVRDDGVGVTPGRLADMNARLEHPPALDVSVSRHMGLYAVSRIASRHGIRVKLRPGSPAGLSALVWLPGSLASRDKGTRTGSHSRPLAADAAGPVAARPALSPRYGSGRHQGALLGASGQQPALPRRTPPSAQPAPAWFAAKRPSRGRTRPPQELSASWRKPAEDAPADPSAIAEPPAMSHEDGPGGAPGPRGQSVSGLPRRVPRARAYPGSDTPPAGLSVSAASTGTPVLGAPVGEPLPQDRRPGPPLSSRRSPEAARNRLSAFQQGGRDAASDGYEPGVAPHTGEPHTGEPHTGQENSR